MHAPTRREIARMLALGAAGLTLGRSSRWPTRARASEAALPRRIVFVFAPNGINDESGWSSWVTPGARADDFVPSGVTEPLRPRRDQLVYFDGLDMIDDGPPNDTHVVGQSLLLTATSRARWKDGTAQQTSVDQVLAARVGRDATPQWPSLELAVQPDSPGLGSFSFLGDGSPVPPRSDPLTTYRDLFGQVAGDDGTLGLRVATRRSVLDSVVGDIEELRARVGADDRQRMDAQLDAVRTMEARLVAPIASCEPPTLEGQLTLDDPASFRRVSRAQIDLLVAALACDVTRIASLMYRGALGGLPCLFEPVYRPETMHELSHERKDSFDVIKRVHFEEIAYLVERLRSIPEGGGTMLDRTLVFCGTEISDGHHYERMPFLTIGGGACGVRTGQYLRLPSGTAHSRLLTSFLHFMGLADETFGDTGRDRSAIADLFA